MKRFFICLVVVLVFALSLTPAFAAEGEGADSSTLPLTVNTPVTVTVEDNDPVVIVSTDVGTAIRSQLASAVVAIFGEYSPFTQTVTTYFADGSFVESVEVVPGLAGMDWVWISGVVLFALSLYCIFRMIGGIFRWK